MANYYWDKFMRTGKVEDYLAAARPNDPAKIIRESKPNPKDEL